MSETETSGAVSPSDWWERFHQEYDAAAADFTTELGLFYERHQKFVQTPAPEDPSRPEYADAEWNRVLAYFLGGLSEEFGLVQEREWTGRPRLVWTKPGTPGEASVLIHESNDAVDSVLQQDVPDLARAATQLSVLIMYPDYPNPPGTSTLEAATEAWRARIEARLRESPPRGAFLLVTISAYSWELPSAWKAFCWQPVSRELQTIG